MLNSVKNNNSKYEHNNYEYLRTKQHSNHSYKAETQVDARVNREKKIGNSTPLSGQEQSSVPIICVCFIIW